MYHFKTRSECSLNNQKRRNIGILLFSTISLVIIFLSEGEINFLEQVLGGLKIPVVSKYHGESQNAAALLDLWVCEMVES